jgi:N-acetylglucosamine-6-sulfatase
MKRLLLLFATLAAAMLLLVVQPEERLVAQTTDSPKPNIVYVFTDDQDELSLQHMSNVQDLLKAQGTTFENAVFSQPSCCPSRASMLTGKYVHNTNVWSNNSSHHGGYQGFVENGNSPKSVAVWMNNAGYETGLYGKYLNHYGGHNKPPGWDEWRAWVGQKDSGLWSENGKVEPRPRGHVDAVFGDRAVGFIKKNAGGAKPLFLWTSFSAPHLPADYQNKYKNTFAGADLPQKQKPSFNEDDVSDKPPIIRNKSKMDAQTINKLEDMNRRRLRSLQTVDAMVGRMISELQAKGELNETYFVFFTDNGFQMGEHRIRHGKGDPYEESLTFPLIVRGPDVLAGATKDELISNIDLAPTFAEWGSATPNTDPDGRSFADLAHGQNVVWRDALLSEKLGWRAIRTADDAYIQRGGRSEEYYDLQADPYQLQNKASTTDTSELEARLHALEKCSGSSCRVADSTTTSTDSGGTPTVSP